MKKLLLPIGDVYARLTIVAHAQDNAHGRSQVTCRCMCGTKVVIAVNALRTGNTRSCGCLRAELSILRLKRRALPPGTAHGHRLFARYKNDARKCRRFFGLTFAQFETLTRASCHYCGTPPQHSCATANRRYNGISARNGMDRVNNAIGYVASNLVPCCWQCNRAKNSMTAPAFLAHVERIALHQARALRS